RGVHKRFERSAAVAGLAFVAVYLGGLGLVHRAAYANTLIVANDVSNQHGEKFIRAAAMPMLATPFRCQSVAQTDRAIYRFVVGTVGDGPQSARIDRFEKPASQPAQLVAIAERDRRAQVLLDFARFPIGQLADTNCVGRTLVQFADLRYTEPGGNRGNFS